MSDSPRRSRPTGAASSRAASPAIAVVIAILAAVVGFFILKKLDNDSATTTTPSGASDSGTGEETQDSTVDSSGTGGTLASVTPTPAPTVAVTAGSFRALVANGSGVQGSAGSLTSALRNTGMQMSDATNILDSLPKVDTTIVYFEAGSEAQAAFTAKLLGCAVTTAAMPSPKPVDEAAMVGATVLIVLGKDLATTVLQPCTDGAAAATPTAAPTPTAAGAVTAST